MKRTFAALGIGLLVLGSAACSSNNSSPTTTAAGGGTSSTAASGGGSSTTAGGTKTSTPKVTKPANIDKSKIDKSKIPSKVQSAKNVDLTEDESDCVAYIITLAVESDPSIANDDATIAGLAGASLVACVPKDKIAAGIVAEMKKGAPNLTDAQAKCVEQDIASADDESLTLFIAALAYGSEAALEPFVTALSNKCSSAT